VAIGLQCRILTDLLHCSREIHIRGPFLRRWKYLDTVASIGGVTNERWNKRHLLGNNSGLI
jgi:hypothetical protein